MNDAYFRGKRVLVTGGAGFIGSHLADRLLAVGAAVHVVDDLSSGRAENLPLDNPKLAFDQYDVGAGPAAGERFERAVADADFVYHLASPIGVGRAHHEEFDTTARILRDGLAVVEACRRHRRPLLYTSSSEVYGPGGSHALKETDASALGLAPRWGYGAAKLALEHLVVGLWRGEGIATWVVRFFNVVGPRQRAETGLVVPAFCRAALTGAPLVVHGDGSDRRTFLHVSDAAAGLLAVGGCERLVGQAVNIGGVESLRIRDLARHVLTLAGGGEVVNVPYQDAYGDNFASVPDRRPDVSLIESATGWRPRHSLDEAIHGCLRTMREEAPAGRPAPESARPAAEPRLGRA